MFGNIWDQFVNERTGAGVDRNSDIFKEYLFTTLMKDNPIKALNIMFEVQDKMKAKHGSQ